MNLCKISLLVAFSFIYSNQKKVIRNARVQKGSIMLTIHWTKYGGNIVFQRTRVFHFFQQYTKGGLQIWSSVWIKTSLIHIYTTWFYWLPECWDKVAALPPVLFLKFDSCIFVVIFLARSFVWPTPLLLKTAKAILSVIVMMVQVWIWVIAIWKNNEYYSYHKHVWENFRAETFHHYVSFCLKLNSVNLFLLWWVFKF